MFFIIIIAAVAVFIGFTAADNRRIAVRKYSVSAHIPQGCTLRIVHISDIHKKKYKNGWEKLILKIKAQNPDVIFITGDLVTRTETDFACKGELISALSKICPVYLSRGNHELDLSRENMDRLRSTISENGGIMLENRMEKFVKNGITLNIYGTDLKRSIYRNEKNGFSGLENYTHEELQEIFGEPKSPSVLLAHNPLFFESYARWGAELTFSGHVHGGVVNTPLGGLLSPERKFFPKYTKGVYRSGKSSLIVTAGLGKLRLFNPPEVLVAELSAHPLWNKK